MKNPWLKKNPLLSMWLSGANAVTGAARGRAIAEARRQSATITTQAMRQVGELWGVPPAPPGKRKRKKSR